MGRELLSIVTNSAIIVTFSMIAVYCLNNIRPKVWWHRLMIVAVAVLVGVGGINHTIANAENARFSIMFLGFFYNILAFVILYYNEILTLKLRCIILETIGIAGALQYIMFGDIFHLHSHL